MKRIKALIAGCASLMLAGVAAAACSMSPGSPGAVAAQAAGQLFCMSPAGTAAMLDSTGAPIIVTGMAQAAVSAACADWEAQAVPVSPPSYAVPPVSVVVPAATG